MPDPVRVTVEADLLPLIPGFLENRRSDLEAIRTALRARDVETVQRLGHNMKGAGAGYGFDGITGLGAGLEDAAKQRDLARAQALVAKLEDYLERVEVVSE
jgi:HPt (histidine-containing phosphotransfer) domain-containing protein